MLSPLYWGNQIQTGRVLYKTNVQPNTMIPTACCSNSLCLFHSDLCIQPPALFKWSSAQAGAIATFSSYQTCYRLLDSTWLNILPPAFYFIWAIFIYLPSNNFRFCSLPFIYISSITFNAPAFSTLVQASPLSLSPALHPYIVFLLFSLYSSVHLKLILKHAIALAFPNSDEQSMSIHINRFSLSTGNVGLLKISNIFHFNSSMVSYN